MILSNYLAEVWGISLVVVSLALLIKEKHIKRLLASIEAEENFFLWGLISLVIGVAMVLAHNIWVKNWQVVITIFGWLSLIKGLSLLFLPELVKKWSKKIESAPFLPYALLVAVLIGLALTYFGFAA